MTTLADNGFEEIKVIGRGQYGKAHLVKSTKDDNFYVAKAIDLQCLSRKERDTSLQEVALLRRLAHPNIVDYQDSFFMGETLVIIMQHCEGGDLSSYIKDMARRKMKLREVQVMKYFVQILHALQYIHQERILHRDLKTSNLFLLKRRTLLKVGDFGISRVLEGSVQAAITVVGTPYYMSPEVCENKPYTYKSDVWALGCVLYELCQLKHAFFADNLLGLVYKIVSDKYEPIPRFYSQALNTLIQRTLEKGADKRPSVDDLLADPYVQSFVSENARARRRGSPASLGGTLQRPLEPEPGSAPPGSTAGASAPPETRVATAAAAPPATGAAPLRRTARTGHGASRAGAGAKAWSRVYGEEDAASTRRPPATHAGEAAGHRGAAARAGRGAGGAGGLRARPGRGGRGAAGPGAGASKLEQRKEAALRRKQEAADRERRVREPRPGARQAAASRTSTQKVRHAESGLKPKEAARPQFAPAPPMPLQATAELPAESEDETAVACAPSPANSSEKSTTFEESAPQPNLAWAQKECSGSFSSELEHKAALQAPPKEAASRSGSEGESDAQEESETPSDEISDSLSSAEEYEDDFEEEYEGEDDFEKDFSVVEEVDECDSEIEEMEMEVADFGALPVVPEEEEYTRVMSTFEPEITRTRRDLISPPPAPRRVAPDRVSVGGPPPGAVPLGASCGTTGGVSAGPAPGGLVMDMRSRAARLREELMRKMGMETFQKAFDFLYKARERNLDHRVVRRELEGLLGEEFYKEFAFDVDQLVFQRMCYS